MWCFVLLFLAISTTAIDCLERLVCYLSSGTLCVLVAFFFCGCELCLFGVVVRTVLVSSRCYVVVILCGDTFAGHGTEHGWQDQPVTEEKQAGCGQVAVTSNHSPIISPHGPPWKLTCADVECIYEGLRKLLEWMNENSLSAKWLGDELVRWYAIVPSLAVVDDCRYFSVDAILFVYILWV